MEHIKKFFHIETAYKFEFADFAALLTVINVVLLITAGTVGAWFGLCAAVINFAYNWHTTRRINCAIMQCALVALNIYFITA